MDAHPRTDRLSLVIPAFNEAEVIAQAIREAESALAGQFARFEVLVVDDGSTDDTASRVERLLPKARRTQLLRHATNRGYGAALRTGFEAARYDLVAFTDADCQFDLTDLGTLASLAAEYPIAAGYRADRKDPWRRRFFSWGYNTLARMLLGTGLRDVDCALKVFRRDVLARAITQVARVLREHRDDDPRSATRPRSRGSPRHPPPPREGHEQGLPSRDPPYCGDTAPVLVVGGGVAIRGLDSADRRLSRPAYGRQTGARLEPFTSLTMQCLSEIDSARRRVLSGGWSMSHHCCRISHADSGLHFRRYSAWSLLAWSSTSLLRYYRSITYRGTQCLLVRHYRSAGMLLSILRALVGAVTGWSPGQSGPCNGHSGLDASSLGGYSPWYFVLLRSWSDERRTTFPVADGLPKLEWTSSFPLHSCRWASPVADRVVVPPAAAVALTICLVGGVLPQLLIGLLALLTIIFRARVDSLLLRLHLPLQLRLPNSFEDPLELRAGL